MLDAAGRMRDRLSRARHAPRVVGSIAAAAEVARAEQISVEAAARAAGLAVETATATVNGVTIYYRDIGPRGEPRDAVARLSRNRRHVRGGRWPRWASAIG